MSPRAPAGPRPPARSSATNSRTSSSPRPATEKPEGSAPGSHNPGATAPPRPLPLGSAVLRILRVLGARFAEIAIPALCLLAAFTTLAAAPVNDRFGDATQLSRQALFDLVGTNVDATREACARGGEPVAAGALGRTVWWSWAPPQHGFAVIDTADSALDTVLGVYLGKDPCFPDTTVAGNDDAGGGLRTSWVGFDANDDFDYQIQVDTRGQAGPFQLHIKLYTIPEIVGQPAPQSVPEQTDAFFEVSALGARPMTYQWQFQREGTTAYVNLPNSNNPRLDLRAVTKALNQGLYRCVVTNLFTNIIDLVEIPASGSVTSTPAHLEVRTPPVIVQQPAGGLPNSCASWTFLVRAVGEQPLAYDWQFRRSAAEPWESRWETDDLSTRLQLDNLSTNDSGDYRVVVTNTAGVAVSDIVQLRVAPVVPTIVTQPTNTLGIVGERAELVARATGCRPGEFQYQWFYRTTSSAAGTQRPVEFENGPEIAFDPVEETHAGYYLLEITDSEGPVARTAEVLLTVERRPPNDDFRKAFEIPPVADYTTNSFNKNGTVEPGEKPHAGVGPFHSIWWQYQTNSLSGEATILGVATVTATLDKGGVKSSPRLVIYTGDRVSALTQVTAGGSPLRFSVTSDTEYHILVDGVDAAQQGDVQFQFKFSAIDECPQWVNEPFGFTEFGDFRANGGGCRDRVLTCLAQSLTPLSYYWLFNGVRIPGADGPTLNLSRIAVEDSGNYQAVAVNSCLTPSTSRVAQVMVTPLPGILRPPTLLIPGNPPFSLCSTGLIDVIADGCPPLTYQWRHNGTNIAGANRPQFTNFVLTPSVAGDYDVVVANHNGAVTGRVAVLAVETSPVIKATPQRPTYALCERLVLAYEGRSCDNPTFQWRQDGFPIEGATDPTLTFPSLGPEHAGAYDLLLFLGSDVVTSKVVQVTISSAPVITSQPPGQSVRDCSNVSFCVQTAPSPCAPLTYQWFRQLAGAPAMTPIPGETNACLNLTHVTIADRGTYLVEVSNGLQSLRSAAANLAVDPNPVITLHPAGQRVRLGQTFTNVIAATSCTPIGLDGFVWELNGRPVVLDDRHLRLTNGWLVVRQATTNDHGDYRCQVSNQLARVTSATARVRVVTPPPNDDFANRVVLRGTNVVATTFEDGAAYHNELASREPGEPDHAHVRADRSVWWTWTSPTPGRVTLETVGSQLINPATGDPAGPLNTLLAVYLSNRVDRLVEVAYDDDSGGNGASRVTFLAAKGKTFHFAVDGKGNAEGTIRLRLSEEEIISPPIIDEQPISLAATNGETAVFTVVAHGSPDLVYQWTKDAFPIPGATSPSLVLTNVQKSDEANYRVTVSNEYPPETNSYIARLTFGAILRGQVTDATNDKPIPGARVCVGTVCTTTDQNGNYELVGVLPSDLQAGFYAVKRTVGLLEPVHFGDQSTANSETLLCIKRPEYIDFEDARFQPVRGQSVTNKISMSPVLTGMRFVLNWGREPADLDIILLAMTEDGSWYQIDWRWPERGIGPDQAPYITFDKDERNSFGPETITVHRLVPGAYRLYVKNSSLTSRVPLPKSGAAVRIYQRDPGIEDNKHLGTVTIPSEDTGTYWHIANIDGYSGEVVWVNRLVENPPILDSPRLEPPSETGLPPVILPPGGGKPNPTAADLAYLWELGDGMTRTNRNATNILYAHPGCFDVGLTVSRFVDGVRVADTLREPCYITVTNGAPAVHIAWPPHRRLFRAGDDVPFDIIAFDTDRVLAARRIVRTELHEIIGNRTNFVAAALNSAAEPDRFKVTRPGYPEPGVHTFVASSTDNHGATTWSSPVLIDVRALDGDILIIRNKAHPEIDCIYEELNRTDMEIPVTAENGQGIARRNPVVRILDQEGLHFDLVRGFRLILWDDCGLANQGLSANTAAVLRQAWEYGIPLYLIGENLVADAARFVDPQSRADWFDLLGLAPGGRAVGAGLVVFEPPIDNELFHSGWYGVVEPFEYPHALHPGQPTSAAAQVRATRDGEPVLVRQPASFAIDVFDARRLAQNLLVCTGDDGHSLEQRRVLLRNAILWLMRNDCDYFSATPWLQPETVHAQVGQEVLLKVLVDSSGRCPATGVIVSNLVACGLEILSTNFVSIGDRDNVAEIQQQGRRVRMGLPKIAQGSLVSLELTVRANQPGTYINRVVTTANYRSTVTQEQTVIVEGADSPGSGTNGTGAPALRFRLTTDGLVLCAAGPSPCDAQLEESTDLRGWTSMGDAYVLTCERTCFDPIPTRSPAARFFRLRCR